MSRWASGPGLLIALALALWARPGATEEIAVIDDIVVDHERPEGPTADDLIVVVAATGETQAGSRSLWLSADDEVRTGAGVQAVLRFPNPDSEVDLLVFIDENSAYQVVDSTTVRGFFGRLFASVSGLFSVITPGGNLGVEGTEFEVAIVADGAIDIQVLEGVVAFAPSGEMVAPPPVAAAPPPAGPASDDAAPSGTAIEIQVASGARKKVEMGLTVTNGCPETERFAIDSPAALPWVQILAVPQPVEVPANGSAAAASEIWIDASGVDPGVYRGEMVLRCIDCGACTVTRRAVAMVIEVVGPPDEEARPEEDAIGESEAPPALRIGALERFSLETGKAVEAPQEMIEDEVVNVLGWTDDVFVAVQPTYAAAGDPPHFADVEDRSQAFRSSRYGAVWKEDPKARSRLGNVYKDWGEDRRASKAYREAATADSSFNESAEFVASWAEANRRAGRLEKAEEQAERAVALDPRSGRANVALGNVYRSKATMATETADPAEETLYLSRSLEAYKAASDSGDPADPSSDRRTRGVAATNLAETYTALARTALAKGETETADRQLIEAQQAVQMADLAYSKAENPFLFLAEGQIQQERARLARARGDEEGSKQQLELAQKSYSAALERHRDLAPAHYRIATVYEDRGDPESAEREYQKSTETQPTYSPAYDRLGKLKEAKNPGSGANEIVRGGKFVPLEKFVPLDYLGPRPGGGRPVPDLTGLAQGQAELALDAAGFALGRVSRQPRAGKVGAVVAQDPAPKSAAAPGTRVDLTLALPTGSFAMPDLRGLGVEQAQRRLVDYGLGPARIRQVEKKGQKLPVVTGHSPRPGKKTSAGKKVELEVAVPKPAKVPKLIGESQAAALRKLQKEGLAAGQITLETSCEGEGRVLRQSPSKGTKLLPGSPVELVVATPGPGARAVPGLLGGSARDAERTLSQLGFKLGRIDERESDRPKGTVLDQQPAARTILAPGCPVGLTIAKPVALVEVPNLVGESLAELQRTVSRVALSIAGVELGRVVLVDSSQFREGTVVRQQPAAGTRVKRGSNVDVWVARRTQVAPPTQQPVIVPNFYCKPAKYAADVLQRMGLRVSYSGKGGDVLRQSPAAGARVSKGAVVTLYLNTCVR